MYVIVIYDVGEKRVAKVCKYLRQHLNWVQNSAFEGQVTPVQLQKIKYELSDLIEECEDSVYLYQVRDEKFLNKEIMGIARNLTNNII